MGTIERLGLLKMDFLGLRTLTVIRDTLDMMRALGVDMKPEDIPMDDKAVYDMISAGDTDGVFQLEGSGMRSFLTAMRPENFEDIIAAISLYRPGPMESIPRYIQGKQDPSSVHYETPLLKPILDVTYGCMVYQEQVMQIVRDLAGYSYGRSDLVRRAMAKKKHKVMEQEREYFVHGMTDETGKVVIPGCVRNGVPEDVANQIYDEMISFASYAFNKSHAAAYSVVAMETGWLKRYHPVPFMAAIMNSVFGNSEKIAAYIQYCRGRNIPILPPSVNTSTWKFTVEKQQDGTLGIRFGLGAVKGVGAGAVEAIVSERQKGSYTDIFDFCRRINTEAVNKRVVDSLIRAGAFDCTGAKRSQMMPVYEAAMDSAATQRKNNVAGQMSLFDFAADMGMAPETPRPAPRAGASPAGAAGHGEGNDRRIHQRASAGRASGAVAEDDLLHRRSGRAGRAPRPRHGLGRSDGGDGRHSDGGQGQGHQEGGLHGLCDAGGFERADRGSDFPKGIREISGHDCSGRFGGLGGPVIHS